MPSYPGPLPPHVSSVMPPAPRRSRQQFPLLPPHPPLKTSTSRSLACRTRTRSFLLPLPAGKLPQKKTPRKPPKAMRQTQRPRDLRKSRWKPNPHPLPTSPSPPLQGGLQNPHPQRSTSLVRSDRPPRLYPQETADPSTTSPLEVLLPKVTGYPPPLRFLLPVTKLLSPRMTVPKISWISGLTLDSLLHLEQTKRSQANSSPPPRGPSC